MKIIKINQHTFYRILYAFGSYRTHIKFDGTLVDHSNATFKWIEYVNS